MNCFVVCHDSQVTWNAAVSFCFCQIPVVDAVIVSTDMVLGALSVVVTVPLTVGTRSAA